MKYHKLRFLLPVLCLVAWAVSYIWHFDAWCATRHTSFRIGMLQGDFQLAMETIDGEFSPPFIGKRIQRVSGPYSDNSDIRQFNAGGLWATWMIKDPAYPELHGSLIGCNFVWLFGLSIIAAFLPYPDFVKRFSLHTLLIATTLVAVGLGIIVWLA